MVHRNPTKERYWRELVQKQRRSGLTARQFCLHEDLDESSFYHWRRELRMRDLERSQVAEQCARSTAHSIALHPNTSQAIERRSAQSSESPVFMPIRVAEDRTVCLEVVLECGTTLRIPAGFDRDTLSDVLEVLERTRC
jgi:hypothetical protein